MGVDRAKAITTPSFYMYAARQNDCIVEDIIITTKDHIQERSLSFFVR